MSPTLVGLAAGLVGAIVFTHVMGSLLFGVRSMDLLTFGAVLILLGGVALVASFIPAWRSTWVDPMEVIRYE